VAAGRYGVASRILRAQPWRLRPSTIRRMRAVRLFAMDVDGVLTEGHLPYTEASGVSVDARIFAVKDGLAIAEAIGAGIRCAVITSKKGPAVRRRCMDLGIADLVTGRDDKGPALLELLAEAGLSPAETAYVGDDLQDLSALRVAGLAIAPSDAAPEVLAAVHHITRAPGGAGCVREVLRDILIAQDHWGGIVRRHSGGDRPSAP